MSTTDFTIMNYFEIAHDALVQAAKIAHLERHPEAENISSLIDKLEDIDLSVCGKVSLKQSA